MDYGRTDISQKKPADDTLFASGLNEGAGTEDANVNNFEAENNLDTNNLDAHWDSNPAETQGMDTPLISGDAIRSLQQNIGGGAMYATTPETPQSNQQTENIFTPQSPTLERIPQPEAPTLEQAPNPEIPALDQATSLEMPPGMTTEAPEQGEAHEKTPSHGKIRTTEHLNEAGLKAIEQTIEKFEQDGRADSFVNAVRDLTDENVAAFKGGEIS